MKSQFPGYFKPTEHGFKKLWEEGLFVFDANTLLNIYRYSTETRKTFIDIIKQLIGRIWIPYNAALEFHKNRLTVIQEQMDAYEKLEKESQDVLNRLKNLFNGFKRHPYLNIDELINKLESFSNDIQTNIGSCNKKHPDLINNDDLRNEIVGIFKEEVGEKYSREKTEDIIKIGHKRYQYQLPPGYSDKSKDNKNEYGDLIIWFQILDKAKSVSRPILFITDDNKEDWWERHKGKTIGPRPELIQEIYESASVDFYMYTPEQFIKYAQKYLHRKDKKEAISEVRDVSASNKGIKDQRYCDALLNYIGLPVTKLHDIQQVVKELPPTLYNLDQEYSKLMQSLTKTPADYFANYLKESQSLSQSFRIAQLIGAILTIPEKREAEQIEDQSKSTLD